MMVTKKPMRLFWQFAGLFFLCLFAGEAFADLSLYVNPNDRSVYYLGMIFGGNVGPLHLSNEQVPVIGRLFGQLNTVVFALGTIMIGYITVVSTINTAKEGKAMGQKWSSLWIPLRSILGLLIMIPTPATGYSAIQVTVMWIVLQGIGAANSVWNVALDALLRGETVTGTSAAAAGGVYKPSDADKNQAKEVTRALFQGAMCAKWVALAHQKDSDVNADPNARYRNVTVPLQLYAYPDGINTVVAIGDGGGAASDFGIVCGASYLSYNMPVAGQETLDESGKKTAIMGGLSAVYQKMVNLADLIFAEFQKVDNAGRGAIIGAFFDPIGEASAFVNTLPSSIFADAAQDLYAVMQQVAYSANPNQVMQEVVNNAKKYGWIHAGSYYMTLGAAAQQTAHAADTKFINCPANQADANLRPVGGLSAICGNNPQNTTAFFQWGGRPGFAVDSSTGLTETNLQRVYSNPNSVNMMTREIFSQTPLGLTYSDPNQALTTIIENGTLGDGISTLFSKLFTTLTSINNAVQFGQSVKSAFELNRGENVDANSMATQVQFTGVTGASIVNKFKDIVFKYSDPLLGIAVFGRNLMIAAEAALALAFLTATGLSLTAIGSCMAPTHRMADTLISTIVFPMVSSAILLWTTGATFAVYIPMIPYLIFTGTAVGWMVGVIEAMIAAPIFALGFVTPSGDELGKSVTGVLILTDLFVKPSLMIFGFIFAARLLRAVLSMVNFSFVAALNAGTAGVSPLLGWIVPTFLYAGLILALINKCFGLIHLVPEKVMRWLGHQGTGFSVEDMVQKAEKTFGEGAGAAQGVAKGAGEGMLRQYGAHKEGALKKKAEQEQQNRNP